MAERPGVLRVGDRVLFGGGEHQVVGLAGNAVRLLAVSGQAAVVALPVSWPRRNAAPKSQI